MGRFDFVVYEKQGRSELPILAIELDGKEHFEDAVVKERDRKKNAICKAHNMEIIRVENSYARRYNHIKGILMDYFQGCIDKQIRIACKMVKQTIKCENS